MKCRKCGGKRFSSHTMITGYGSVDLTTLEVEEVDGADFDLEEVDNATCMKCYTEYTVKSYIEGSEIKLKLMEEIV